MLEDQTSSTDAGPANPVDVVLAGARRIGMEHCWPAASADAVVRALGQLQQVVLGWEIWELGREDAPRVLEWSTYDVDLHAPWDTVVIGSVRMATEGLASRSGSDQWVAITWLSAAQAEVILAKSG